MQWGEAGSCAWNKGLQSEKTAVTQGWQPNPIAGRGENVIIKDLQPFNRHDWEGRHRKGNGEQPQLKIIHRDVFRTVLDLGGLHNLQFMKINKYRPVNFQSAAEIRDSWSLGSVAFAFSPLAFALLSLIPGQRKWEGTHLSCSYL